MVTLTNIRFTTWLAIVSIIGFATILVASVTGLNLKAWADSLLFMVIGFALFVQGGAKFFVYFKDGLTPSEINRIVTVVIGFASIITGILIAPIVGIEVLVLDGIKAIIAIIAILVIIIEEFVGGK